MSPTSCNDLTQAHTQKSYGWSYIRVRKLPLQVSKKFSFKPSASSFLFLAFYLKYSGSTTKCVVLLHITIKKEWAINMTCVGSSFPHSLFHHSEEIHFIVIVNKEQIVRKKLFLAQIGTYKEIRTRNDFINVWPCSITWAIYDNSIKSFNCSVSWNKIFIYKEPNIWIIEFSCCFVVRWAVAQLHLMDWFGELHVFF